MTTTIFESLSIAETISLVKSAIRSAQLNSKFDVTIQVL